MNMAFKNEVKKSRSRLIIYNIFLYYGRFIRMETLVPMKFRKSNYKVQCSVDWFAKLDMLSIGGRCFSHAGQREALKCYLFSSDFRVALRLATLLGPWQTKIYKGCGISVPRTKYVRVAWMVYQTRNRPDRNTDYKVDKTPTVFMGDYEGWGNVRLTEWTLHGL